MQKHKHRIIDVSGKKELPSGKKGLSGKKELPSLPINDYGFVSNPVSMCHLKEVYQIVKDLILGQNV